ncbi:MAG TPA: hypothetical protein VK539_19715 [Myxococcaceae bacterium]|nr:hypothetical protein [Myxococcaceae bacterium]
MEPSFPCAAWNSAQTNRGLSVLGALLDRQATARGNHLGIRARSLAQ